METSGGTHCRKYSLDPFRPHSEETVIRLKGREHLDGGLKNERVGHQFTVGTDRREEHDSNQALYALAHKHGDKHLRNSTDSAWSTTLKTPLVFTVLVDATLAKLGKKKWDCRFRMDNWYFPSVAHASGNVI